MNGSGVRRGQGLTPLIALRLGPSPPLVPSLVLILKSKSSLVLVNPADYASVRCACGMHWNSSPDHVDNQPWYLTLSYTIRSHDYYIMSPELHNP